MACFSGVFRTVFKRFRPRPETFRKFRKLSGENVEMHVKGEKKKPGAQGEILGHAGVD